MIRESSWCAAPDFLRALAEIVDVNVPQHEEDQYTPIHLATSYGDIDLLKILLQRPGADPNLKDYSGKSPLYEAMYWHMIMPIRNPLSKLIRNVIDFFTQCSKPKHQKTSIQIKQIEFLELLFFHGVTVGEGESILINQLQT